LNKNETGYVNYIKYQLCLSVLCMIYKMKYFFKQYLFTSSIYFIYVHWTVRYLSDSAVAM